ncbi:MAG: VWA domain-containing protein [Deltaproteobacteria bacterium]|nr:VWA domain-containing protein [Deltaproteobacteria bacterium]
MNVGLWTTDGCEVPLRGVEVTGEVAGALARVRVRQRYAHRGARPVEAVYTFPLPADAVLAGFTMTCQGRTLVAEVQEREAAFRAYDDAVLEGHGAALVEQERDNVFTATVGNLLPGEETVLELTYLQRVRCEEGALRWMLPTVVAPRYTPGAPGPDRTAHGAQEPTDRVPDADRVSPPQGEAPYTLALDMTFDVGRSAVCESPSHTLVCHTEDRRVRVRLARPEPLDRDLVVLLRDAADGPFATVTAHRAGDAPGVVAFGVVPDLWATQRESARVDVVFALDTSGSMEGSAIEEARAALRLCLRHLREGDRFNVVAFSSSAKWFSRAPVPFDGASLRSVDRWVAGLRAGGGTELLEPLADALGQVPDGVVVLLTDGQVSNEDELLRAALGARRSARVYSFGIGTAVSDALLRALARSTQGAVEFIHPGERIDEKVVAQFARAVAPRVTQVTARFVGLDVKDLAPATLPDLVDGEPWTVLGRYDAPAEGRLELRGRLGGRDFLLEVPVTLPSERANPCLPALWAWERVRDLESLETRDPRRARALQERVVALATEYGIASRYTSFVVVERREGERRVAGLPETRVVPVAAPAGSQGTLQKLQRVLLGAYDFGAGAAGSSAARGGRAPASRKLKKAAPPPQARRDKLSAPAPVPAPASASALAREASRRREAPGDAPLDQRAGDSFSECDAEAFEEESACLVPQEPFDPGALLAQQDASGLWPARRPLGAVETTTQALTELVAHGVGTADPTHGALVRKAVEALLAALQADPVAPELVPRALAAAWLASSGARTRRALEALVASLPGAEALRGRLGDDAFLRGLLGLP